MQNTTVSCLADTAQKNEGVPSKSDRESCVSPTDGSVLFVSYCPNVSTYLLIKKIKNKSQTNYAVNSGGYPSLNTIYGFLYSPIHRMPPA